jgi:putative Mn2+ efflux pump MntP
MAILFLTMVILTALSSFIGSLNATVQFACKELQMIKTLAATFVNATFVSIVAVLAGCVANGNVPD